MWRAILIKPPAGCPAAICRAGSAVAIWEGRTSSTLYGVFWTKRVCLPRCFSSVGAFSVGWCCRSSSKLGRGCPPLTRRHALQAKVVSVVIHYNTIPTSTAASVYRFCKPKLVKRRRSKPSECAPLSTWRNNDLLKKKWSTTPKGIISCTAVGIFPTPLPCTRKWN